MILRIRQMLHKEFLQMFRDVRMRMVVLVMPLVQMTVLAFALTTDVKNISTAVVDPDNSPESRRLIAEFTGGDYFSVTHRLATDNTVQGLLDAGRVRAVIRIPPHFSGDIHSGKAVTVQLLVDGTLSNDAAVTINYASQAVDPFQPASGRRSGRPCRDGFRFHGDPHTGLVQSQPGEQVLLRPRPHRRHADPDRPGAGFHGHRAGKRDRHHRAGNGHTDPTGGVHLGKTLPFLATGMVTMTLMFLIARVIFGIRIQGSLTLLYATAAIYILGNLGLALLVSVTARTQQQALLTAFFILVPAILLSGFIFPIRNMPEVVQWFTVLNPMRWFLQVLHGVVVKGVGIRILWLPIGAQVILATSFLILAVSRFRKTLE